MKCKYCKSELTETIKVKNSGSYEELIHKGKCPLLKGGNKNE